MDENKFNQTVLIVDDEPANIRLLKQILQNSYEIRVATNGTDAIERASIEPLPDLILLDITMPVMDGYEVCRKLKSNMQTSSIPVIFVTAMTGVDDETKGFNAGAVDYIQKPVSAPIVRARVKSHIALKDQRKACEEEVKRRTLELEINQLSMINMLGEAGHYNDTDTGVHIWRMSSYSQALAQAAGWSVEKARLLRLASPMHDTGKIGIPDDILKAPRKLTDEEWRVMKRHTTIGHSILSFSDTPLFSMACEVALNHHEKWSGGGYPNNLSGLEIPESARIVAIADVFDALTMKRPYKEVWSDEKAFDFIQEQAGIHFDPDLAHQFVLNKDLILDIKEKWSKRENYNGVAEEVYSS